MDLIAKFSVTAKHGQMVAVKTSSKGHAAIRLTFVPDGSIEYCDLHLLFAKDEDRDEAFDKIDKKKFVEIVSAAKRELDDCDDPDKDEADHVSMEVKMYTTEA